MFCVDPLAVKPELHQLNFGFLVGNNFLCKPTHLWIAAIKKFRFCHVNGGLVMRQHQVHEVSIAVAGWFYGSHGGVHRFHVLHQGYPVRIVGRHVAHQAWTLRPHGDRDNRNHDQKQEAHSECHFFSFALLLFRQMRDVFLFLALSRSRSATNVSCIADVSP
jgi:hypothetical protein